MVMLADQSVGVDNDGLCIVLAQSEGVAMQIGW